MERNATLSTEISAEVKDAVTRFCRERGLKLRYLVEHALIEQIEDAIDLETYHARRSEKTVPLSKILARRKRKR